MRILFILTQDIESPGGLGRYLPLAVELVGLGHKVQISALHPDFSNVELKQFEIKGVRVHYSAPMHVKKAGNSKTYYSNSMLLWVSFKAAWELSRDALAEHFDIIHVGKIHPMNSIAGLIGRAINKSKLFVDFDDNETASARFSGNWQKIVVSRFENKMPYTADLVTSNTITSLKKLKALGIPEVRLIHIPNGVDRDRFAPPELEKVEKLRESLGLVNKKVILFIGTISLPSHPIDILVNAFSMVEKLIPDSRLLLVGGGEDIQTLKDLARKLGIEQKVIFSGRIQSQLVPLYYHIGNVSVDPVRDDLAAQSRSPLKMFESWASGIPFITSDVGDRSMIAGNPPAALLTPPNDPIALAEGISHLLTSSGEADRLANLGLKQVDQYYWDQIARKSEWIYR
jgi:glycosyltransferase involved in cell wall biosynthesis